MLNVEWLKLKHLLILLLIIVVNFALFGLGSKNDQTLIASGHPQWAPIMSQSGDKIVGAGPELTQKIFGDMGIETDSRYVGSWDTVQAMARSGEIDVIVAAYKTDKREDYMDFSDAYAEDPIAVFASKQNTFTYEGWSDLIGKRGVATVGDSYGQALDAYMEKELTVVRADTPEQAFKMLEENQADYFLYSLYAGQGDIKSLAYEGTIEALPEYAATEIFYIAISKKSPFADRMPEVNRLLKKYKEDGTINALVKKYQG